MDILFLGTSSGTPTRKRNVSGTAIIEAAASAWYLVDCGEGTQHRLLHTPLSLHDLQAIFITHVHGDHCYGLPGLLATAGLLGRKEALSIIAPAGIESWIMSTLQLTQLLLPYPLQFIATESLSSWNNSRMAVDTFALSHRVPSYGYRFREVQRQAGLDTARLVAHGIPRGPIWGQLQKGIDVPYQGSILQSRDFLRAPGTPRCIVVAGDNDRPELLRAACEDAQVLVHEATYTADIVEKLGRSNGHSTAADVAAFAQSIGLANLVLTHFSARYQADANRSPSIEDVRSEAAEHYRGQLILAEDFARYRLDKSGKLSRTGQ